MNNYFKLLIISLLGVSVLQARVINIKTEERFMSVIKNNPLAVVYFYDVDTNEYLKRGKRYETINNNYKVLNSIAANNRYKQARIAFYGVNVGKEIAQRLKKRYNLTAKDTFALFRNGKMYSDDFLVGEVSRWDLEDFIEDYFGNFIDAKTIKKPARKTRQYTTTTYRRPVSYTYYDTPNYYYPYNSYYYPYNSYYYGYPYYYGRPSVGFGFSFGG